VRIKEITDGNVILSLFGDDLEAITAAFEECQPSEERRVLVEALAAMFKAMAVAVDAQSRCRAE